MARAAKEAITGKGKRGQKRKMATREASEPMLNVTQRIEVPKPWRAPVAKMI